jgi:hypothetical protein
MIRIRAMNDKDGPFIAERFYKKLFENGTIDAATVPYALDYAVTELRKSGVPPERWATFIHMGVTKVENVWADLRTTCAGLRKRGLGNCRAHGTKRDVHACAACALCTVCPDWAGCTVWSASSCFAQSVQTAQRMYTKNQNI